MRGNAVEFQVLEECKERTRVINVTVGRLSGGTRPKDRAAVDFCSEAVILVAFSRDVPIDRVLRGWE